MGRRKPGTAPLLGSGNQPAGRYGGQRDEEGSANSAEERRMNTPLSFGTKFAFGMGKKDILNLSTCYVCGCVLSGAKASIRVQSTRTF